MEQFDFTIERKNRWTTIKCNGQTFELQPPSPQPGRQHYVLKAAGSALHSLTIFRSRSYIAALARALEVIQAYLEK